MYQFSFSMVSKSLRTMSARSSTHLLTTAPPTMLIQLPDRRLDSVRHPTDGHEKNHGDSRSEQGAMTMRRALAIARTTSLLNASILPALANPAADALIYKSGYAEARVSYLAHHLQADIEFARATTPRSRQRLPNVAKHCACWCKEAKRQGRTRVRACTASASKPRYWCARATRGKSSMCIGLRASRTVTPSRQQFR